MNGTSKIRWECASIEKPKSKIEKLLAYTIHTLIHFDHKKKKTQNSFLRTSQSKQRRMSYNKITVGKVSDTTSIIIIDIQRENVNGCLELLGVLQGGSDPTNHPILPRITQTNQQGTHQKPIGAYAAGDDVIYERNEDNPPSNVPPTPPDIPKYLWINVIANVLTPKQVQEKLKRIPVPELGWRYITVVYLNVPYGEQNRVKSRGAIWSAGVQKWVSNMIYVLLFHQSTKHILKPRQHLSNSDCPLAL